VRVYHFLNENYGLEDIALRRIKVSRINDLNDPFELSAAVWQDQNFRTANQQMLDELNEITGLLCFSRDWHNPVQWSHYAHRHTGLCLGFDVPGHWVREVQYRSKRIQPNLLEMIFLQEKHEEFMAALLTTKFAHWRYEQEIRAFVRLDHQSQENGLYFFDFSENLLLKEVIVGVRSSVSRKRLSEALGNIAAQVKCRKARLAFNSFRVVEQRKASLWV